MQVLGISGRIASAFINSKLTPLLVVASLLLGVFATVVTPREEEPQIMVPMIDVMVSYPGASAREVEARVTTPMEKFLWEIKGVEYVYSIVKPGFNLTIVRFYVGENSEESLVKLYNKLMSHYDQLPPGISQPLVKPKSIDDVPILSLTLWSPKSSYTGYELRRIGMELCTELKKGPDVSETTLTGGQRRQVRITLDPARLKAYNLSGAQILQRLQQANVRLASGAFPANNREVLVETGNFFATAQDVGDVVVQVMQGRPVYLRDVADITDGPQEPADYVFMGFGPAAGHDRQAGLTGELPAVTLALSKKKGANASMVAQDALARIEALRGHVIPSDLQVTVTRDYGATAKEKSNELLDHMLIATISVIILIALALGRREALVVAVAVPVTLALTLLISYLYGYTLNRVTLFALIFSIGILVDDAIVVVENITRHFRMHKIEPLTAVLAVDEVGNPTILATFTVIAALLPMAFVSGLMGPYMRPIPVGASAAMLFSLLVAFIVSPWLAFKVLKNAKHKSESEEGARLHTLYEHLLGPLIASRRKRHLAYAAISGLLLLTLCLLPLKLVAVKMLPFDNKSEVQIIIDMPEGSSLEQTAAATRAMAGYLRGVPEVMHYQSYIGTAAPYNFNGLVRHYFLRRGANLADIQVNFVPKEERAGQSHTIAKRLRGPLKAIADQYGARLKVAEIPPGPPVLSTLVAEVYGPDEARRIAIARQIRHIFDTTPGVVDVDLLVEADQPKLSLIVDQAKAAADGVSTAAIAQSMAIALGGQVAGLLHAEYEKEPLEIVLRMPEEQRSDLTRLLSLGVPSESGALVPLSALVQVKRGVADKTIYHKNLKPVTYVLGEVAGQAESPVYAIQSLKPAIAALKLPEGYGLKQYAATQPWVDTQYAMKWDGEWHITYEVFRDMGIAFAAVLVLIYVLVVAWFRSFATPLIIMTPIPLTLVGILPGHWAFGAFFTATSMIGFIALAGIVVRNSILLVDFIQMQWRATGDLPQALIKAGAVRFRPIVLTAAAVVVGSFVMLFDPIFQGLAIAMMFGAVASTALTLIIVPLLYYSIFKNKPCPAKEPALVQEDEVMEAIEEYIPASGTEEPQKG